MKQCKAGEGEGEEGRGGKLIYLRVCAGHACVACVRRDAWSCVRRACAAYVNDYSLMKYALLFLYPSPLSSTIFSHH